MSKELEALLTKITEQNEANTTALSSLVDAVTKLSASKEETPPPTEEEQPDATAELSKTVETLSAQMADLPLS